MALYKNLTASALVKTGVGKVYGFIINSHTSGTLRLNDGVDATTSAGVKATGVLTGSGVFSNTETITIEGTVYTMLTALTNLVANEVLIGANLAASLDNLKLAINAGAGEGTNYSTGTVANPNVTATTNTDTAQTVEAYRTGTYGNAITTTETAANASWGAVVLESGVDENKLVMNTFTLASGSQIVRLPAPVDYAVGLYFTEGGTTDVTIIYD